MIMQGKRSNYDTDVFQPIIGRIASLAGRKYGEDPKADVAGVEFEMRKNIFNTTTIRRNMRRLSLGVNASYIHSRLEFTAENTTPRNTGLEGASPWLVGGDVSYNWSSGEKAFNVSLVAGWFSDRVHTLGTRGYKDTVEEGVMTISVVSSKNSATRWLTTTILRRRR